MPESSASPQNDPPKVLSDLQTEQTTLNRVSHRLAMTDPGPALEKVLSLLLPRLLSRIGKNDDAKKKHKKQRQDSASANNNNKRKLSGEMTVSSSENTIIYDQIDSVHDAIHKKLIEMLTHTMKRVREDRSCKLPCGAVLELLTTTQQQQSSDDDDNGAAAVTNAFTVNLSLMFLTLGLNRCSPKECASLLPGLLQFWASILRPTNNTNNDDDDATTSSSIGVLHFMDPSRKMRHDQTWHLIFRCLESISHNPTETAAARRAASSSSNDDGKSAAEEFKQRQAKSLVLYHLHKFALECDCTLCFVHDDGTNDNGLAEGIQKLTIGDDTVEKNNGDNGNDDTNNDAQKKSALTIDELGKVIRRVAMGLSPVVKEEDVTSSSAEGESKTEDVVEVVASLEISSAIHAPGSHDAELIHGAYLRNASCEGQWDASKDDLIVALPPPPQSTASNNNSQQQKEESKEGTASRGGDEEWLSKLAASVGLSPEAITTASSQGGGDAAAATATASTTPSGKKSPKRERPVVKKRTTRAAASKSKDGKPKDQKEVMNFFDDLLKK
mmetsp:Transcript_3514/g.5942  ORF Transcript_3514/g.5942 Transcript_3514/m.5942 type:complete len:555 (-) Transcript_3514:65-1729(-)